MTAADMKRRVSRLNQACLDAVEKANELNDIHAMLAKSCSYLMRRENNVKPCLLYTSRASGTGKTVFRTGDP